MVSAFLLSSFSWLFVLMVHSAPAYRLVCLSGALLFSVVFLLHAAAWLKSKIF